MQDILLLVQQTIVMFLLAGIGALLYRTGKLSDEGSKSIGNLLIYLVLPCVIIKSFLVEKSTANLHALGVSAVLSVLSFLLCILLSSLIFRKDSIAHFAVAFPNPGFFGIPLIIAVLGEGAVFYVAVYIGFLNLLQFTYGVSVMQGNYENISINKLLRTPFVTAITIGLILFTTQITLPGILTKTLGYITGLNTPLAMLVVGVYLAQTDLPKMFRDRRLYLISAVRLLLIPLITVVIFSFVPARYEAVKTAVLIATACPVGSNIAVYARLHDKNHTYAVETVTISTLLSILTIPAILLLAGRL